MNMEKSAEKRTLSRQHSLPPSVGGDAWGAVGAGGGSRDEEHCPTNAGGCTVPLAPNSTFACAHVTMTDGVGVKPQIQSASHDYIRLRRLGGRRPCAPWLPGRGPLMSLPFDPGPGGVTRSGRRPRQGAGLALLGCCRHAEKPAGQVWLSRWPAPAAARE